MELAKDRGVVSSTAAATGRETGGAGGGAFPMNATSVSDWARRRSSAPRSSSLLSAFTKISVSVSTRSVVAASGRPIARAEYDDILATSGVSICKTRTPQRRASRPLGGESERTRWAAGEVPGEGGGEEERGEGCTALWGGSAGRRLFCLKGRRVGADGSQHSTPGRSSRTNRGDGGGVGYAWPGAMAA